MILKVFATEEDFENDYLIEIIERAEEEGYTVEKLDTDSEEAHLQTELYNIYVSPSFVVAGVDGTEIESWRGRIPPLGDVMEFLSR